MSETIQVLTAEQLATMSPSALLAYAEAITTAAKAAASLVSEAKAKQSIEAQAALQERIRKEVKFAPLGADMLKALQDTGAKGFTVSYLLEDGKDAEGNVLAAGTPIANVLFKQPGTKAPRAASTGESTSKVAREAGATQQSVADYEALTTPEERAADEAIITERTNAVMARNGYGGDRAGARKNILWKVKLARCREKRAEAAKSNEPAA